MREAPEPGPLVYLRSEPNRILYAALTGDLPISEYSSEIILESFRQLFNLNSGTERSESAPTDFEEELRADATALIGRAPEIERAKAAIKQAESGVLWIGGPGGVGKSFLMAKLATELGHGQGKKNCRIAWRFQLRDQERGNATAFLRHAVGKVQEWLKGLQIIMDPEPVGAELGKLLEQFGKALAEVVRLKPTNPLDRPPRLLIFLDGLDEIGRAYPPFLEISISFFRRKYRVGMFRKTRRGRGDCIHGESMSACF